MKKFLLISALAIATIANANVFDQTRFEKVKFDGSTVKKIDEAGKVTNVVADFSERKAIRAQQAAYAGVDYYYTPGWFHNGFSAGLMGFSFASIVLPFQDSVVYTNLLGATDWYINGKLQVSNSATFVDSYWLGESAYYVPETADHDFEYQGTTYKIKGTSYGNTAASSYVFSGLNEHPEMLGGDNIAMTLCAMQCDTMEDTHDYWRVGGSFTGDPYFNGTGIHLDSVDRETTADALGVYVDFQGVMKFDEIILTVYSDGAGEISTLIPENAKINVNIFPFDKDGKVVFNDTLASTVITQADFEGDVASWGVYGTLSAKFYEMDIFGTITQVPVYAKDGFFLEFTNYNESGCNFGFFSDYDCPVTGTTVYKYKGQWQYRAHPKAGGGKYGQNLLISFDGYFPTINNDTTINEMNAPVAGGYAYYGQDTEDQIVWLISNVNYEDWEFEADEWIEPQIVSTDYWESSNAIALAFEVEALPEGEQYREGTVTFIADGAEITLTISQGENPHQGIKNVEAVKDNKTYDVLGREVKNDFKGVVIRNGEKFVR